MADLAAMTDEDLADLHVRAALELARRLRESAAARAGVVQVRRDEERLTLAEWAAESKINARTLARQARKAQLPRLGKTYAAPLPAQISHIAAAQGQPGSCSALGAEAPAMQRQPWQQMQADEADLLVQLAHAEVAVSDIQRQLRACREARLLAAHREIVRLREERDEARREVEDRAGDGCKEWS